MGMFTRAKVKSEAVSPVDNQPFRPVASAVRHKEQGPCFFFVLLDTHDWMLLTHEHGRVHVMHPCRLGALGTIMRP